MNLSFARQNDVISHLAGFRFLTQPQIDEFLFAGSSLTALSRQVIVRRILARLRTLGLVQATPRVVAPAGGTARLVYFLTAAGYNRGIGTPRCGRAVRGSAATRSWSTGWPAPT